MPLGLWQILPGNTACRQRPQLSGVRVSAAAYGQARAKRPRRVFDRLLERFGSAVQRSALDAGRWPGPRTVLVAGSGGSLPATPARQEAFGQSTEPRPGCGVPGAYLLGLCQAGTGVLRKRVVAPLLPHALAQVQQVHPMVAPGDVLVADRGLGASAPLALRVQAGVHAVRRVGARPMGDFTPGRPLVRPSVRRTSAVNGVPRSRWLTALGVHDQLVAWWKPTTCPAWLTRQALAARPEAGGRRAVRDHMGRPGFRTRQITLATTLLDADIDHVADRAERYRQRWPGETSLAHRKTTMRMEVWHGQTGPGVLQELTVLAMVSTLVRLVMWHAAILQHLAVERLSVLDARRWLGAPSSGRP
jgi:hypothetical protein